MAKKTLKAVAQARKAKKVNVNKNYGVGSFSFKGSGRNAAYRGAARAALRGGASVIAAHKAGMANSRRAGKGELAGSPTK